MTGENVPAPSSEQPFAPEIARRLDALAAISAEPDRLTRLAFTPEMARATALVSEWMGEAGMEVRPDGAGNLVGRYEGRIPGLPALLIGSHLDTVRDAGRYDGTLGVLTGIACVARLAAEGARLPFAVEVLAFGDEEGTRFGTTVLGSRAVAGTVEPGSLDLEDADGVTARDAITAHGLDPDAWQTAARRSSELLAYLELHIEQGPELERHGASLGCVTGIAGASRMVARVRGRAGHAGTVPMDLRRDALTAASACILEVEAVCRRRKIVGTVGRMSVAPGAANVIPGEVGFSIDIRALDDGVRLAAVEEIRSALAHIAAERAVAINVRPTSESRSVPCAPWLMSRISAAIATVEPATVRLPSGAGHDAAALAAVADIGMIFVRCTDGVSHHPAEHVRADDIERGARALLALVQDFPAGGAGA